MTKAKPKGLKSLGKRVTKYTRLETFESPKTLYRVTLISDEVTAVCPVTGQPDWYKVEVIIGPTKLCIESKTFKLFLQSLRNEGMFCEALAERILKEVKKSIGDGVVTVKVTQKPRGGVSIIAEANN